jgi:SAM-dependent methyltransferase
MKRTNGRIILPEMLDSLAPEEGVANLRDLARINRWLGGHRILISLLRRFAGRMERFSFLDVGAASGDMGERVRQCYPHAHVVSLDRSEPHLLLADGPRVAADAFHLPFNESSFDFVFCSSFLHHYPDSQAIELIVRMLALARRALVVLDLERHPFAYHFLSCSRRIFGWHEVTISDGRLSVQAGFRPAEMVSLARAAGTAAPQVRRHFPWFRISLVIPA